MSHEILDEPQTRQVRDPQDMLGLVLGLPDQVRKAWELGQQAPLPDLPSSPSGVAVLGMGGSGIGGDLLRTLLAEEAGIPAAVVKGYRVPKWVNRRALVFAVSYSGNTEETLTAYEAVRERGSAVVAITSGGRLAEMAHREGVPLVRVPQGLPPRAALGYLFFPMLAVMQRIGAVRSWEEEVEECIVALTSLADRLGPGRQVENNPAKQLATKLLGRIPAIYAASTLLEPAALRWKCQMNENGKTFAVWNVFPELNHNETVGWGLDPGLAEKIYVVLLRDHAEEPRVARRVSITVDLALHRAGGLHEVWAEGRGKLVRLFSAIFYGDLTSVYLAYLRGVDPTPVQVIEELKQRLGTL